MAFHEAALCAVQIPEEHAGGLSLGKSDDGLEAAETKRGIALYPPWTGANVKWYVCAAASASTAEASTT